MAKATESVADKLAKPLGDRVLLTEIEAEASTTAYGIIIPDSAKSEDVKRAKVEAVGDELEEDAEDDLYEDLEEDDGQYLSDGYD